MKMPIFICSGVVMMLIGCGEKVPEHSSKLQQQSSFGGLYEMDGEKLEIAK